MLVKHNNKTNVGIVRKTKTTLSLQVFIDFFAHFPCSTVLDILRILPGNVQTIRMIKSHRYIHSVKTNWATQNEEINAP